MPEDTPSDVEVWRVDLDLAGPLRDDDRQLLTEDEMARVLRYRRHEDRVRAAVTRAALRRLLAARLGRPAQSLRLSAGPHGKPMLMDAGGLDFNVSHAGACALIGLSACGAIGLDIERCDHTFDVEALCATVLSPAEQASRGHGPAGPTFFERWVVKEAALKALGLGVGEHLRSLSVWAAPAARYRLEGSPHWPPLSAWRLPAPAAYVAALAHAAPSASCP